MQVGMLFSIWVYKFAEAFSISPLEKDLHWKSKSFLMSISDLNFLIMVVISVLIKSNTFYGKIANLLICQNEGSNNPDMKECVWWRNFLIFFWHFALKTTQAKNPLFASTKICQNFKCYPMLILIGGSLCYLRKELL